MTRIQNVVTQVLTVPLKRPEADGTLQWQSTTVVIVEIEAGGKTGLGMSYASKASGQVVHEKLREVILGQDVMDIPLLWRAMLKSTRNLGRPGAASLAISAVDLALWDLKARLLGLPLVRLLGAAREQVPIYGSGGFTSYSEHELASQLAGWTRQGIRKVKMKVGSDPTSDEGRVRAARLAIGESAELYVDANGAFDRKQALDFSERFENLGVSWFEEPVSSDDLEGLRFIRERVPKGMRVAAGEYGFDPWYFRNMLESQSVDVLQADITRCLGGTGFLSAAALSESFFVPLSSHCAPAMHLHFACHVPGFTEMEYFHDHIAIEALLFDGIMKPHRGTLRPDLSRPGMGLELKRREAQRFAA